MNQLIAVAATLGLVMAATQDPVKPTPPHTEKGVAANRAKAAKPLTIPELKAQLKDSSAVVRRSAAQQLGSHGVRALEAVPAMIEALADTEPMVRATVAEALGGIGVTAKSAVPTLIKLLKDSNASVRETAAEALADIGVDAPKVVPALMELLSDSDMNVRCAGAKSLGDYRAAARDALPALEKMQKQDKHPFARDAAAEAVQSIKKALQKLDS
jgi:HEAT repeat protein